MPVFLVKQEIPRGTTGTEAQAYIARETIPRKFMPGNAIASLEDISGKIAISKPAPNQVVVGDMFVDASASGQQSFSERLKKIRDEDQVTVTIQVDKTRGAANLIQPGDYVNILLTNSSEGQSADTSSDPGGAKTGQSNVVFANGSRYLYQKILVLAIDSAVVPQPGEAATTSDTAATPTYSGAITFIVPARAAADPHLRGHERHLPLPGVARLQAGAPGAHLPERSLAGRGRGSADPADAQGRRSAN